MLAKKKSLDPVKVTPGQLTYQTKNFFNTKSKFNGVSQKPLNVEMLSGP